METIARQKNCSSPSLKTSEERFVTAWIKISLEGARELRKRDPVEARRILLEVLALTEKLGLDERTRNVKSLLEE